MAKVLIIDLDGVVRDWDPMVASAPDCLFADDTAGHVSAAGGLGLRAHHFRSAPGLAAFVSASVVHPHPRG